MFITSHISYLESFFAGESLRESRIGIETSYYNKFVIERQRGNDKWRSFYTKRPLCNAERLVY
jgi:hypothetical protein